jgi:hypothetical protein
VVGKKEREQLTASIQELREREKELKDSIQGYEAMRLSLRVDVELLIKTQEELRKTNEIAESVFNIIGYMKTK